MAEQIVKVKKKEWFQLVAPPMFNSLPLGETMITDPARLVGRIVAVNLSNITNELKQQSINIRFRVVALQDKNAHTEVIGYELSPSAIRRLVRRSATRIDDSQVFETADKKTVKLKPFLVTKAFVRGSAAKAIRKNMIELLKKEISKANYESLVKSLISNKLQITLKSQLSKIYPIRSVEFKTMQLLSQKKEAETMQKEAEQK